MQLELFGEAFNLFNRFNYYSANFNQFSGTALTPIALSATSFGMPREVIGAQPTQRVIQLGTKFTF
jgi:hypothetical protein